MRATDAHDQAHYERELFRDFAAAAHFQLAADSIRSHEPPHPDVSCRTKGGEMIAFELVQVVDQDVARVQGDQHYLQRRLREACVALPTIRREHLKEVLGNALVAVSFAGWTSRRVRAAAVPRIIEALENLARNATGDVALRDVFPFVRLKISRGQFLGPSFQVLSACCFGDPLVDLVHKKFSKRYQTRLPMELLVFYHHQVMAPDALWLPELTEFVSRHLDPSPFRRVWVYDARQGIPRFVFPRPTAPTGER